MTPQRPALAEVLAALDAPADGLTVGDGPAMSPDEAVEVLATARLWPWEPGDDPTRWWCERCLGGGRHVDGTACVVCDHDDAVSDYRGDGHAANPPTLAALVAVASLGAGRLARYVELAGEIARAAGCEGARVVWRSMTRDKLRACAQFGDETPQPTGVHLVVIDASRIVLAVEAL